MLDPITGYVLEQATEAVVGSALRRILGGRRRGRIIVNRIGTEGGAWGGEANECKFNCFDMRRMKKFMRLDISQSEVFEELLTKLRLGGGYAIAPRGQLIFPELRAGPYLLISDEFPVNGRAVYYWQKVHLEPGYEWVFEFEEVIPNFPSFKDRRVYFRYRESRRMYSAAARMRSYGYSTVESAAARGDLRRSMD